MTDGQAIYALFGSRGLYCLEADGRIRWRKDLGRMNTLHAHGEGSSPVVHGGLLVVNWDHEGASFIRPSMPAPATPDGRPPATRRPRGPRPSSLTSMANPR